MPELPPTLSPPAEKPHLSGGHPPRLVEEHLASLPHGLPRLRHEQELHAQLLKQGLHRDPRAASKLTASYALLRRVPACCCVFYAAAAPDSLFFIARFMSIFATGILEMRWSGVSIEEWWRNEQFWVIGGVYAHLFAVVQDMLKMLAGIDTNFTVTYKATGDEDDEFAELYAFHRIVMGLGLDFYSCIKLINFVRSKMTSSIMVAATTAFSLPGTKTRPLGMVSSRLLILYCSCKI